LAAARVRTRAPGLTRKSTNHGSMSENWQ
jgi:hypothetical protein